MSDWTSVSIPREDFERAFGRDAHEFYAKFIAKVNKELKIVIHASGVIRELQLVSSRKDSGGNTHVLINGSITLFAQDGSLGGEFVWLRNLKSFRGKAWSSLESPSDKELLMRGRESFRTKRYNDAKRHLEAIQDTSGLPNSATRLKEIVRRKLR